jgi:uncharacterized protein
VRIGVLRKDDGTVVCARCAIAATPLQRMRGLLGRSSLDADEGLLIRRAGSIHMLFMRFAIDAVFCDRDLRVVAVRRDLRPWRFAAARGARAVVELPAGGASGLAAGDQLVVDGLD